MKSTRSSIHRSSSQAILQGLSQDGGLFVFDQIDPNVFSNLEISMSYSDVATIVFTSLLDDYSNEQIRSVIQRAYQSDLFAPAVTTQHTIGQTTFLELYNGPTFAFKDLALSALPLLFETAKEIQGVKQPTVIVTATSGDTGSAALSGFSKLSDTHVIVLYPTNGVSAFQERQMNAFQSDTNKVFAVDGNFDDCQRIAKELFQSYHPDHVLLSSANSINIGRIIPQIVYYMYSYLQLQKQGVVRTNESINIAVPTGNFGNIYAAYLAKQMGLPVHRFIVASNQNNVLTDVFQTGQYIIDKTLYQSISPSMDIVVSSNLERYLYHLLEEDTAQVKESMETLHTTGKLTIEQATKDSNFYAGYTSEKDTVTTIQTMWKTNQYLIDPHTAVASSVVSKYQTETKDNTHTIIASTANPYKFIDAMLSAFELSLSGSLEDKMARLETYTNVPMDERMVALLHKDVTKQSVSKEQAIKTLIELVGEIR